MEYEIIVKKIIQKLRLPPKNSHKGDNGRLLIIAGSRHYHGSLLYAVKAASRIVDLVYVLTTRENQKLVQKLKEKTASFIAIYNAPLTPSYLKKGEGKLFDCVLIGPGMGESRRTYNLVRAVLKSKIRAVLDADALKVIDKKLLRLLGPQHILTPHRGEFERLLKISSTSPFIPPQAWGGRGRGRNVEKFMRMYGCTIVLKGKLDIVASPGRRIALNSTGNEGMTKGGTGDVLAGIIAAFYCKNNAFTSAAAGVYLNGLAGDELYRQVGPFYSADDLVAQIPKTLWKLVENSFYYESSY